MTLPPLQFPLYRFADEVGAALVLVQHLVDALKGALRKSRRGLFVVDLRSSSSHAQIIDDITNCFKPRNLRYHLLRSPGLLISSNHQQRRRQMFRQIDNHKRTASVHKGIVTMTYDTGWDDILDCQHTFTSDAEATAWLLANGFEGYDPNAHLKAQGFVFINGTYQKPAPQ